MVLVCVCDSHIETDMYARILGQTEGRGWDRRRGGGGVLEWKGEEAGTLCVVVFLAAFDTE